MMLLAKQVKLVFGPARSTNRNTPLRRGISIGGIKTGGIEPIQSERRWRPGAFRLDEMYTIVSSIPFGSTVILIDYGGLLCYNGSGKSKFV